MRKSKLSITIAQLLKDLYLCKEWYETRGFLGHWY